MDLEYVYEDLRNNILPPPERVFSIFQQADSPANSRDCRPLMEVEKKTVDVNLRLRGHLKIRKTAVTAFGWSIKTIDGKSDKYAERATLSLMRGINCLLENHAKIEAHGCALIENQWGMVDEMQIISSEYIDPTLCEQGKNSITLLANDSRLVRSKTINRHDFDPNYILGLDNDSYERGGLLRTIFLYELIRREMIVENANFLKKVKGILQIIDKGAGGTATAAAEKAARTAVKNNVVITNDLLEFKLNSITAAGGGFKELIELLNDEISIAILGQANTTQLPNAGGSRAALQVLKSISADIHYSDIIRVESIVNEQLLPVYWQLNQNKSAATAPLVFSINLFEEQDRESNAIVIRESLAQGIPLKKSEVYQQIGFSEPADSDVVFESTAQAGLL